MRFGAWQGREGLRGEGGFPGTLVPRGLSWPSTPDPRLILAVPWLLQPGSCALPTGPSAARTTVSACGSGASVMALTTAGMGLMRRTVVSRGPVGGSWGSWSWGGSSLGA